MSYSHQSTLLSSPRRQPPVLRRQIALLAPAGRPCRLHQHLPQPATPRWRPSALFLPRALVVPRTHPRPFRQLLRCRKRLHVRSDFSQQLFRGPLFDPRNLDQPFPFLRERARELLDSLAQLGNQSFLLFQLFPQQPQQESMMLRQPPAQRLLQLRLSCRSSCAAPSLPASSHPSLQRSPHPASLAPILPECRWPPIPA